MTCKKSEIMTAKMVGKDLEIFCSPLTSLEENLCHSVHIQLQLEAPSVLLWLNPSITKDVGVSGTIIVPSTKYMAA